MNHSYPEIQARVRSDKLARQARVAEFKRRQESRNAELVTLRKQEFLDEAREKLAALAAIVDGIEAIERPHWGDVGDLTDISDALTEIIKDNAQE